MYRLLIYRSSSQRTALQIHFLAVPQCNSRCRDGNTTTATATQLQWSMNAALAIWSKASKAQFKRVITELHVFPSITSVYFHIWVSAFHDPSWKWYDGQAFAWEFIYLKVGWGLITRTLENTDEKAYFSKAVHACDTCMHASVHRPRLHQLHSMILMKNGTNHLGLLRDWPRQRYALMSQESQCRAPEVMDQNKTMVKP